MAELIDQVAICICSINKDGILEKCLESLISKTLYKNFKLYLCIPNNIISLTASKIPAEVNCSYVYRDETEAYSYSKFANRLVKTTESEKYVCLLNDDIEIVTSNWLNILIDYARIHENGIITPKLLFPDGTIQHIGCKLDPEGICYHLHHHEKDNPIAEWNKPAYYKTVTGACSVFRKTVWNEVKGYEESLVSYNDIDFALKVYLSGYWNICTPEAVLIHHQNFTRGQELESLEADKEFMKNKWGNYLNLDYEHRN